MIRRFYVNNFRCLENFELPISGQSSVLLIGKNGSGKSTVGFALEVLQRIARGTNRVGELVKPKDFFLGRTDAPMRFEIEVELDGKMFEYLIAFELPEGFRESRVREERFLAAGEVVFQRQAAEVELTGSKKKAKFGFDWHMAALPIVFENSSKDPLSVFRDWCSRMLILRPVPSLMLGESNQETLQPDPELAKFAEWFSGLLAHSPAEYRTIDEYLRTVLPDLKSIRNPVVGRDSRSLEVQFSNDLGTFTVPFGDLSDGEKIFLTWALVLAANRSYGPLFCFWDEPDNYLSLGEVGQSIMALRRAFQTGGQFVATSHNPEAIRRFSDENTFLLQRKSHLEPSIVRPLSELHREGDLIEALVTGDLEP